jgi:hypothetical protein
MLDVVGISKKVLERLLKMDSERAGGSSKEKFIFPKKNGGDDRISEQELRFLFVEEFVKLSSKDFFYSVETPTEKKYKFGDTYADIRTDDTGRSASIDMSVFKRDSNNKYNRILNIEFKNENVPSFNIGKDILKLIHEEQEGVLIHLLKNTDSGTLCNSSYNSLGVFDKYYESFSKFRKKWSDNNKSIQLIIISLEEKTLIHREIKKGENLEDTFKIKNCGNIATFNINGWGKAIMNSFGEVGENIF